MPGFSTSGMEDLIKAMEDADLFDEEAQTELLLAGTDHLRSTIQEEIVRAPYDLKFVHLKLTKQRKAKKDKSGNYYMTVSVQGKNERGERNATVAFVLNYGRREEYGKIAGSYFWTRAVNRCAKSIIHIYERILTKKLEERGLV